MSDQFHQKGKDFAAFLAKLPKDVREKANKEARDCAEAEHKEFQESFRLGTCYLRKQKLDSFVEDQPCVHWLLNPPGFRKRHFSLVAEKYGYHQIQNFLRWVANEDGFAVNINDLSDEGSGKLLEVTIRYKQLEWSFSCTSNDFRGHGSGTHREPHYHFQMRDGSRMLVRFNDFHVPFSEYDVVTIAAELENPEVIKRHYLHGEGMNAVMDEKVIEKLLDVAVSHGDPEVADFKFDTILMADDGTTMKGEDIKAVIDEAKEKGIPAAALFRDGRIPNAKVTTIVSPGPGVVEQAIRSGRDRPNKRVAD